MKQPLEEQSNKLINKKYSFAKEKQKTIRGYQ
jgi:hypothetical protein